MKMLDDVKLLKNRKRYSNQGIFAGMVGTIINAEIRDNEFYVVFPSKNNFADKNIEVKIDDLELFKDNKISDIMLLDDIHKNNPSWWCKVEDGYILNLKGEKKNKIPYNYSS